MTPRPELIVEHPRAERSNNQVFNPRGDARLVQERVMPLILSIEERWKELIRWVNEFGLAVEFNLPFPIQDGRTRRNRFIDEFGEPFSTRIVRRQNPLCILEQLWSSQKL